MKEVYRSAASVLVLRPEVGRQGQFHVLLLHKPRKRDAWQLPQGGREEGETVDEAALRELMEEAGIKSAKLLGHSRAVYQYDFPASYRRFRPDHVKGQRIEFIFALVAPDVRVTVDRKEVDRFVWVRPDQLNLYVKRKEYLELVRKVYREAKNFLRKGLG